MNLLSSQEAALVDQAMAQLQRAELANDRAEAYYEGTARAKRLNLVIPEHSLGLKTVIGWPGTVVDSLEERLDFQGWTNGNKYGLDQIYSDNLLPMESGMAHLDAMIFGVSFVAVLKGDTSIGEPEVLITVETPKSATGVFSRRTRRLEAGLIRRIEKTSGADTVRATLLTDREVVEIRRAGGAWVVEDRQPHSLGRVPMVIFPNRRRASRIGGRSEITKPVRALTDQAVRTLIGMDVNREFFSAPQRFIIGADEKQFSGKTGWELLVGSYLAIGANEDGEMPKVDQFPAASPAPYVDQLQALSQLLAAEAAVPRNYLGFVTANPSSADAIRAEEARLVKRAERRQAVFGQAWMQVAELALLAQDPLGGIPGDFKTDVAALWRDASTPTRAASADATVKLVSAGVLPASGDVVLEDLGYDKAKIERVQADRAKAGDDALGALANAISRQAE